MELYVVNFDGTGMKRLTESPGYDAEGSYSPDGTHIVFTSMRDGDPDIYVMKADGTDVRQITNVPGYDGGPFFSPNGKWIIFRSDREKKDMLQLYAISADGKETVQLTNDLNQVNWCPYFHPSGKYLIWSGADYSRGPMGANFDLFTMDIDMTDTSLKGERRRADHDARQGRRPAGLQSRRNNADVDEQPDRRRNEPALDRRLAPQVTLSFPPQSFAEVDSHVSPGFARPRPRLFPLSRDGPDRRPAPDPRHRAGPAGPRHVPDPRRVPGPRRAGRSRTVLHDPHRELRADPGAAVRALRHVPGTGRNAAGDRFRLPRHRQGDPAHGPLVSRRRRRDLGTARQRVPGVRRTPAPLRRRRDQVHAVPRCRPAKRPGSGPTGRGPRAEAARASNCSTDREAARTGRTSRTSIGIPNFSVKLSTDDGSEGITAS